MIGGPQRSPGSPAPVVLVAGPDRVGPGARLAALAAGWLEALGPPAPAIVAGQQALACLEGDEGMPARIAWPSGRPLSLVLADHALSRTPVVLWDLPDPALLGELDPIRPTLVIESWPPRAAPDRGAAAAPRRRRWRGRALTHWLRRIQSGTRRCLYCGLWPLIESPEARVLLEPALEVLDPWSAVVLEPPRDPREPRRTLLVLGREILGGNELPDTWRTAAERILDRCRELDRVVFVSGRGAIAAPDLPPLGVVRAGIVPRLGELLGGVRAALIPPSPQAASLVTALGVPAIIAGPDGARGPRARYLAARFGLEWADDALDPDSLLGRAAALAPGIAVGGADRIERAAASRASQRQALRAMVASLAPVARPH